MDREIEPAVRKARIARKIATAGSVLLAVAAALALLPGWLRPAVHREQIRTARVERGGLQAVIEASGLAVPAFEKVLSSPIETRVIRIRKKPGEGVKPGDAIVDLDTTATRLDIERLEETLQQKESDSRQLHLDLEQALGDLESRAESKSLDRELLDYRVEQQRKLFADGLVAEVTLRAAEVEARKARIELRQLEESVETARGQSEARLESLALAIRILRSELDESRRQLELATARADRSGVITWVVPEEGAAIRRGDVLARIADLDSFRVEATVSDVHAAALAPGLPVKVVEGAHTMTGRLSAVHPVIENGVVRFTVELTSPSDPTLRNNLRVDVLVVTGSVTDVLTLAKGPFAQGGTLQQVFVVRGDRAVRTRIRLGLSGHDACEIVEGLSEGNEVIVSDMTDYMHMEEVRIR